MALEVNVTWGDSWGGLKQGLADVVSDIQVHAQNTRQTYVEGDPTLDLCIFVSGAVWKHDRQGFRLGRLTDGGRESLRVMIYVPDDLTGAEDAIAYFNDMLVEVANKVRDRLTGRRPDWPIEELVDNVLSLQT
jgi:hypothetical protein